MAQAKIPSLLDLFKADKPSDLIAGLPTPIVAKIVEQLKAVKAQMGESNVPPDPVSLAIKYPKWKVMGSRHLTFISEKLAETCELGNAIYIATPPKHFKSTLCSQWLPFWFLARNPEAHVLLVSYSATEAKKWGRKVRDLITQHGAEYHLHLTTDKIRADDWELTSGGGMVSMGYGGLGGKQAQLFIIDDAIGTMEDANSQIEREKLWEWWEGTALQRLEPGTPVVVIGTRYRTDDLMGRMLQQSDNEQGLPFERIILPSKALADDPLGRAVGEGLWLDNPRVGYTQKFYDDIENHNSPYTYAALHQQNPVAAGGNMVDPAWWRFYRPSELPGSFDQEVQSWDLSLDSVKKSDSYHAGLVVARKGALLYVRDSYHAHAPITDVVKKIAEWNYAYPGAKQKLVERATSGVAVVQMLQTRVSGMLAWPPKGRQKGSKEACLDACIPDIRSGNVLLPLNPDGTRPKWVQDFIMELMAFPRGSHDDWVDAFSQACGFMLPSVRRVENERHEEGLAYQHPVTPAEEHRQRLHAMINKLGDQADHDLRRASGDNRVLPMGKKIGMGQRRGMW